MSAHTDVNIDQEKGALAIKTGTDARPATAIGSLEISHGFEYVEFEIVNTTSTEVIVGFADDGFEPIANPSSPTLSDNGWGIRVSTGTLHHGGKIFMWKVS
jgi:hypothetical protein